MYGVFFTNNINYEAVIDALPTVVAMALMYILRCYLHATAFRKSAKSVWEILNLKSSSASSCLSDDSVHKSTMHRRSSSVYSEVGVYEEISLFHLDRSITSTANQHKRTIIPQVLKALHWYGADLLLLAFLGTGGGILPGIAVGPCILKVSFPEMNVNCSVHIISVVICLFILFRFVPIDWS